jgi:ubiquinol-cytochrome c reductase cytochrome c1 subunit
MKRMLSRLTLALAGVLLAGVASANEVELKNFRGDYGNVASLQRGARDYMAYCSGCHSMKYVRYSRIGEDLQIPTDLLKSNLMLGTDKPGDMIKSAMPDAAEQWFGRQPPDLSLAARSRGSDWIYTYLQSFYLDPSRPTGVNNPVLPGASMPNVLWELQGWQAKPEHKAAAEGKAGEAKAEHEFEQVTKGSMTPEEYREFIGDITNFMAYAAEPVKKQRIHLGFKVLLFLSLLMILTILLKKEFWRDVH